MIRRATPPLVTPTVTYGAVVGQVIERLRASRGKTQDDLGAALGIGQSAYSRLEQGQTSMTLAQLRATAEFLASSPNLIIREADSLTVRLLAQGVVVKNDKDISPAAVLVGLGILAALIAASR